MIVKYNCPECKLEYSINQEVISEKSTIPSPNMISTKMLYQNHDKHTIFLEFSNDGKLNKYKIIPEIRSIFETLIYESANVLSLVNSKTTINNDKSMLIISTEISTYREFFDKLNLQLMEQDIQLSAFKLEDYYLMQFSQMDVIIGSIDLSMNIIKNPKKYTFHKLNPILRSLVIDCTNITDQELIELAKSSKFDLNSSTRTILSFDISKREKPPLEFRDYIDEKFNLESLDILNYKDTNGLKSILLQSYFNCSEDPLKIREIYETKKFL
jgi:hypothetical protein